MKIAEMTQMHLSDVVKIERQSFTHPWSRASFCNELEKPNTLKIVALDEDKAVGFLVLEMVLDEGNLLDIAVDESYRRKGVGRMLMSELMRHADENKLSFITLEVRQTSTPAIALYEGFGFKRVGMRKNYYSKPTEDAVLMTKFFEKV